MGHDVAQKGDRWAALEPVRQGVRRLFGAYRSKVALGLGLNDWGPQYTATQVQGELSWLGIHSTTAFVGEPECNDIIERFMRTLKEECLYVRRFQSLDEACQRRSNICFSALLILLANSRVAWSR